MALHASQPTPSCPDAAAANTATTQQTSPGGKPTIQVQMFPNDMKLPYSGGMAVIAPMNLTIAEGSLLSSVLRGEISLHVPYLTEGM
jgi:hypothetical protein